MVLGVIASVDVLGKWIRKEVVAGCVEVVLSLHEYHELEVA